MACLLTPLPSLYIIHSISERKFLAWVSFVLAAWRSSLKKEKGAVSSVVRALASHARGHWFKSSTAHAEVAEWQTRYVQGVVSVRMCGFKSHLRHHAPVAQRIERSPAEAEVVGPNPTRRTILGD